MLDSLYIAAAGMESQQTYLNVIANNLSNINTNGFKKERISFNDLVNLQNNQQLGISANNTEGAGSIVGQVTKEFSSGDLKQTERNLDVAIQGNGFFEVYMPNGTMAYTREGGLSINADRALVTQQGYELSPSIQVPVESNEISIDVNGIVSVKLDGEAYPVEIGKIELASFANNSGLKSIGNNLYVPNENSGDAYYATPGEKDTGQIVQGFLEASNVNLVEELTNMVFAQRAYEINSKVIQASDEMLGIINNLRR